MTYYVHMYLAKKYTRQMVKQAEQADKLKLFMDTHVATSIATIPVY